jgi:hypothetical protein
MMVKDPEKVNNPWKDKWKRDEMGILLESGQDRKVETPSLKDGLKI